jgi:hypothetical protein
LDTKKLTDFRLTSGKKDVSGEQVDSIIIQVKAN